ncbi:MAG: O-acetyl-ADP-ribose deacetylase [Acidimicrobiales bacterium]
MPRDTDLALIATKGDVTTQDVDMVVNAANPELAGGGGVDGAIHRAAGASRLQEACRKLGGCEPGDAKLTPGYALKARWIAHAVGPIWRGGCAGEAELLASCYRRCLQLADDVGARSIAFPAISTGVYGFPGDKAALIAVSTLRMAKTAVSEARLVAFDEETYRRYLQLLAS